MAKKNKQTKSDGEKAEMQVLDAVEIMLMHVYGGATLVLGPFKPAF